MKQARIAVIGAGSWGKNLIRNFKALGALDSIYDQNKEHAENIAREHNTTFKSFEEILEDSSIDGVAIATQSNLHFEIASKVLKANKHVFVEKPMALNLKDAKDLCSLVESGNCKLMVGHLLQYHPAFIKLKEMVGSNELGKLSYIYSNRLNFGKIYNTKDALWDLAPHDLSMILSLAQSTPIDVKYSGGGSIKPGAADFAMLNLEFNNDLKAHIFVSWLSPLKEQKLVVIGDKAMAVFDDTVKLEQKLSLYNYKVIKQGSNFVTEKSEVQYIKFEQLEPLKNECSHFIDCIMNNKNPITDVYESIRILEILEKAEALK